MTKDGRVVLVKDTPEFKQKMRTPGRKPPKSGQPADRKTKRKKTSTGQHKQRTSLHKKLLVAPPGQQRSEDAKKIVQNQKVGMKSVGIPFEIQKKKKRTEEAHKRIPEAPVSKKDKPSDLLIKMAKECESNKVFEELSPVAVQNLKATTAPPQPGVNLVPKTPAAPMVASGPQTAPAAPGLKMAAAATPILVPVGTTRTGPPSEGGGPKDRHQMRSDDWAAAQLPNTAPLQAGLPESGPLRSAQLPVPQQQQKKSQLNLNVDEVLRLGAVIDRYGCPRHKKIAFDWLAKNRSRLVHHLKTAPEHLQAALGDVQCDRQLAANAVKELYRCGMLTVEECASLVKIVDSLRPPITIGQIAFLVHETAVYYKKNSLQQQKW